MTLPPNPAPATEGEQHLSRCMFHRCVEHRNMPQLNTNEASGSECGVCVYVTATAQTAASMVAALAEEVATVPYVPTTVPFDEESVKKFLDDMIKFWRVAPRASYARYYIDAYQSMRASLFGSTLPLSGEEDET